MLTTAEFRALGLRVDATSPWVDARLPDGSRVPRDHAASFALGTQCAQSGWKYGL